jgi:hypothetical protein
MRGEGFWEEEGFCWGEWDFLAEGNQKKFRKIFLLL